MSTKKIISLFLATTMALSMTACSGNSNTASESSAASGNSTETVSSTESETADIQEDTGTGDNVVTSSYEEGTAAAELAGLYNSGYEQGASGSSDGVTVVNYNNADHTDFWQASCTMTDEQLDAFFSIDFMAEDYYQQCFDALAACEDLKVAQAELPDLSEYEAYEGKTIQELEDAGFDFASTYDDENGKLLLQFYVYPSDEVTYMVQVTPEGNPDDDGSYDDDAILNLVAGEIVFWAFE